MSTHTVVPIYEPAHAREVRRLRVALAKAESEERDARLLADIGVMTRDNDTAAIMDRLRAHYGVAPYRSEP